MWPCCNNTSHRAGIAHCDSPLLGFRDVMSESAPVLPARAAAPTRRPARAAVRRILVVDDDADAASSLAMILRDESYTVDTAGSAEEAVERFKSESYHLLITDLILPGSSGVELTRTIHESCPA